MENTEPSIEQTPRAPGTLASRVAEAVQTQTTERELAETDRLVMTDDSEFKHDPANPGSRFAKRFFKRLAEQQ
jgi:hypothetical protein